MKQFFGIGFLFSICCIFVADRNSTQLSSALLLANDGDIGQPYRFVEERAQFDYDLVKDPETGRIPEGVKAAELAFAKAAPINRHKNNNSYTALGPNNFGGRTRAVAYDVRNNGVMLAGGVSSGLFRSTDGGDSWTKVSPSTEIHNVTCLAQDTRSGQEDTWYYGTGEALGNSASLGSFYLGNGIYKSTDNGATWSKLAGSNSGNLESFDNCADIVHRLVVDPSTGYVYAAAQRLIMRSQNGGTSWSTVLGSCGGSTNTGLTDIVVTTGGRLYASFSGNSLNTLDGVWTSTTGSSASWTCIAGTQAASSPTGWNSFGNYGRVTMAIAPSDEDIVYVLYDNDVSSNCAGTAAAEADFFKYDQGASSWTDLSANLPDESGCLNGNDPFAIQGGYDLCVAVLPDDENTVFIGGTNLYRSTDGFSTTGNTTRIGGYASASSYALYTNHHPDIQRLIFKPGGGNNDDTLVCGSDGGIHKAYASTGSVTWTSLNNDYITYQYYHVAMDPTTSAGNYIGGLQDNGTTRTTSNSTTHSSIFGGDGCAVGISSSNTYHYVTFQNGAIYRRTSGAAANTGTNIRPSGTSSSIFVTYFLLDPDNTEYLYYADGSNLYRTTTASTATTSTGWTQMTGVGSTISGNIRSMAVTRGTYSASSNLYIGTSNGNVYRLDDPVNAAAGATPTDITPTSMSGSGRIVSGLSVNPRNDDTLMVSYSNYSLNNLWWTGDATNGSPTWTNVEGNLSLPSIRSCMVVAKTSGIEYYAGTSVGLYSTTSLNGGFTTWGLEGSSTIEYAVISSLAYRPDDNHMLVGTHGNGMFYTDMGSPLPVTFLGVTAKEQEGVIAVNWSTATEVNNERFEVERKHYGETGFTKVGTQKGAGNSSTIQRYTHFDQQYQAEAPVIFYRIKQIDFDGKFAYSKAVPVVPAKAILPSDIILFPNPVQDELYYSFGNTPAMGAAITLYNLKGELVHEARRMPTQGNLSVGHLPPGIYLLKAVLDDTQTIYRKIVLQ